jgi:antitoxin component YwqK of YwqJK toxin-antitoxin module
MLRKHKKYLVEALKASQESVQEINYFTNNKMKQLLFFLLISVSGFSQSIDTIYFNKKWQLSNSEHFHYYRVAEIADSTIKISDYYKNGVSQFVGFIELDTCLIKAGYLTKLIGPCTYYDKKGRKERTEIHRPDKYLNLIRKIYTDSLNVEEELFSNLVYVAYFYKNGNVSAKGFFLDCGGHYKWCYYFKNGDIYLSKEYDIGIINGEECSYMHGKLGYVWNYKNGKRHGKFIGFNHYNGNIEVTGNYKDGKKHGLFKYYTQEGELEKIILYNEGRTNVN